MHQIRQRWNEDPELVLLMTLSSLFEFYCDGFGDYADVSLAGFELTVSSWVMKRFRRPDK